MEILLLQELVRCDVIQTVIFAEDGLFGLILHVALVGRWFNAVFVVRWLTLLYRWVCMIVVSAEAGLERRLHAALTTSRGNDLSLRPSVPRRRFLWVCPPCIHHMMKWASSALWAVAPVRLLHRR